MKEMYKESIRKNQFQVLFDNKAEPIKVTVDGQNMDAKAGQLLITVILLHRNYIRDFEFSDSKRAGYCFMGGCQDCWVTLAGGRRVRACDTPVQEGMVVTTEYERNLDGQITE